MKCFAFIFFFLSSFAQAQYKLDSIEVVAKKNVNFSEYWEENKGTQIFSGKKNTITDLKTIPQLETNNYRKATSQIPGLLISEIPNESLAAMTYRGLGDPHESFNVLLLQDGIPVPADMYGYPAHYFSPALPMMDKFQFIRGGASLLYGPQPGGVVNYISHPIVQNQPLSGKVSVTGGSYNLLTTNNAIYGSKNNHSYAVEYYRRQGHGPQRVNSTFGADYVQIRDHIFAGKNKYKLSFNGYNSDHGEPGGFSKTDGINSNVFGDDQGKALKEHDRLKVSRAQLYAGVEHRIDDSSKLDANFWATAYNRYSKRQRGGGFGTFPTGANANTNVITTQQFFGYNGEVRYLKDYNLADSENTFTAGFLNYNIISPLIIERGTKPDSNHGEVRNEVSRETHTNSFFVENRFGFGQFMVTPGVRVESIRQIIHEEKNLDTSSSRKEDTTVNVPLFGIGLSYFTSNESQIYANISEAYKPVSFEQGIVVDAQSVAVSDIDPSKVLNSELGYRGQSKSLNWDASVFYIRYENKFGQVGSGATTEFQNTGAGTHRGADVSSEFKLSEYSETLRALGGFILYANVALLNAQYTKGSLEDKTPMYAPKSMTRIGIIHDKEDKYKVALMGVMVSRMYGDDNNTDQREIPSYTVFDLTSDINLTHNWLVSAGINNLFNREYYSRVRSDGVIWALQRNYYLGAVYKF